VDDDRVKRFYQLVDRIVANAMARPDTSLDGIEPMPGAPGQKYYRLHWTGVLDPDNMPKLIEVYCPFDGHTEGVPEFVAEGISRTDGLLCVNTDDPHIYESNGYLAFETPEEAARALGVLCGHAQQHLIPGSHYGYVELEIALCLPTSFAAPPSVGPGTPIERVQLCRRRR
jgi:hypothetical protein